MEKFLQKDGKEVRFDPQKIKNDLVKLGETTGEFGNENALGLTLRVVATLEAEYGGSGKVLTGRDVRGAISSALRQGAYDESAEVFRSKANTHPRRQQRAA